MNSKSNPLAGDAESLRQANLSKVLTNLGQNAPISRAGLAELTGLHRATITRLVRELIHHGFIREMGPHSAQAGHPSILLQLNPTAGYILGAEVRAASSSVVLTDLGAAIVWRQDVRHGEEEGLEAIWMKVLGLIRQAVEKASESNHCILGLGMSLPGRVDAGTGELFFAPSMKWKHVPVRQRLMDEFDFPILVDSQANMAALCESYFGAARTGKYVLYIDLGSEVGAGFVIGQQIIPGATGLMGEVGHMTIDPDGMDCTCGNHGCWEAYVSIPAVLRRVQQAIQAGTATGLHDNGQPGRKELSIRVIAEAARQGNPAALAALEETAVFLGIGVANLINAFNPDQVVLGGYFCQTQAFMLPMIREVIRKRALSQSGEAAEVVAASYQDDAGLMGAVARVYSQILANPSDSFRAILSVPNKTGPATVTGGGPHRGASQDAAGSRVRLDVHNKREREGSSSEF